jgi:predicted transcriptional regulator of viral defense system
MNSLTFTKLFENGQSAVLTTQQLAVLLDMDIGSATVKLNRLVNEGVLVHVLRGRYTLAWAHILAVASGIYHPSYVTLLAAFEYYGSTTQSPRVIDIFNPVHSGKISMKLEEGQYIIRFVKVSSRLIYGYNKIYFDRMVALVAEKEKAIVDGLLLPEYVPFDETVECIRSGIDRQKAIEYARGTRRQAVMKRLGYLLSNEGIECSPDDFNGFSRTYVPLDPAFPRLGKYDSKWRLIVNRVI